MKMILDTYLQDVLLKLLYQKQKEDGNQIDIKTLLDLVRILDKRNSNDIVLKSNTMIPLKEFSLSTLVRIF